MDLSVQIHANNIAGARRAIVLTKTAPTKVRLDIDPPIALGLVRSIDFKNVQADPTSITLFCQLAGLFSCDIRVAVQPTAGTQQPFAIINISKALQGNGTYPCPLTAGDDERVREFLQQADFPRLGSPI